ncbi:MAG: hypothetical protein BWK73_30580 [Thiothrix lacustris]|uniref:Pilus formation protein N-terminal domain-containing protein n=1 Tax=Thiothrix lacustris TaxID=525917 RepID=A0A1Y1QIY3_9GAMM|nr:MAG: hypothetical protein BWK73_30580 [Thiothrix lacustris]
MKIAIRYTYFIALSLLSFGIPAFSADTLVAANEPICIANTSGETILLVSDYTLLRLKIIHANTPIQVIIEGTREQPDPVETTIRTLEQAGQLRVLRVMESFPLRFEVEGSADVIQQVRATSKNTVN